MDVAQEHARLSRIVSERVGARDSLLRRKQELESEISILSSSSISVEKAIYLLQQYADSQQQQLTQRIEGVVTEGLRAVFQNPSLQFKLSYSETKKGERSKRPEVSMSVLYEHEGKIVEGSLKDSFGGGLSVVSSLLLKTVIVLHLGHRVRPILLLDEPLKDLSPAYGQDAISDGYRERMAEFLRMLTDETDIQIIMVTHEPQYTEVATDSYLFSGGVGTKTAVRRLENDE